jgi:hypothetical protein
MNFLVKQPSTFRGLLLIVIIPIIIFWYCLFIGDYPPPHQDDIFFVGAALNLVTDGEFKNPYILSPFTGENFYLYTPFHSFVLAAWLNLVGISKSSLTLFQCFCGAIISIAIAILLRRYSFPVITAFLTTLVIAIFCRTMGLRPEILGLAFMFTGFSLLAINIPIAYFLGFFLVASAIFTQPVTLAYAFVIGAGICFYNFHQYRPSRQDLFVMISISIFGAFFIAFLFFIWCINFNISSFIDQFQFNVNAVATPGIQNKIYSFLFVIFGYYGYILYLPSWILLSFVSVSLISKLNSYQLTERILLLSILLGIFLNIFLHGRRDVLLLFLWLFITVTMTTFFSKNRPQLRRSMKVLFISLWLTSLLLSQSLEIISSLSRGKITQSSYETIQTFVNAHPNYQYIVDASAARYVFNYRLPKNSISWIYHIPAPEHLRGKVIYIGAPYFIQYMGLEAFNSPTLKQIAESYPRVSFLGRRFNSLPQMPFEVSIIELKL